MVVIYIGIFIKCLMIHYRLKLVKAKRIERDQEGQVGTNKAFKTRY